MKNMKYIYLSFFLIIHNFSIAQEDDLPPTDDPPVAPINEWVPLFIIIALFYGFYIFKKNTKTTKYN
jgi:hypothetical protein